MPLTCKDAPFPGPPRYTLLKAMEGKRILFVVTKSVWGGAQAYVYALATALAARGALVSVAAGGEGLLVSRLREANIAVIPIPSLARDFSLVKEWGAFIELRRVIRTARPDILHLNSSKAGGIGALAGRLEKVPHIVFTAHGWPHREPGSSIRTALVWLASYVTVLLSHTVIVVSRADAASSLGKDKRVVHIPLGLAPFTLTPKTKARALLRLTKDAYVIGTIAELTNNKGLAYGIRAFARLKEEGRADTYVIIGEGELRESLMRLAHKLGVAADVRFPGFLPDARSYLSAFDLFLLPSLKEGLPYALLEATMAGLPIVASNVGGIPDALSDEQGALVPPRDPEAIAAAIEKLRDVPRMKDAENAFPLEQMIERTADLYLSR